jgi:hypothetical protein
MPVPHGGRNEDLEKRYQNGRFPRCRVGPVSETQVRKTLTLALSQGERG